MDPMQVIHTLLASENEEPSEFHQPYRVTIANFSYQIVARYQGDGKWDIASIEAQPF